MSNLLKVKPLSAIMGEATETGEHTLKRSLGSGSLIALGIGAIIGTGIFVLTGTVAAQYAGPGVVWSFIAAAIGCVFAGLCYAEFSAMIPVAGSAYTYGYATLGELFAWIIGWDLVLEYAFGAATVCSGWSGYVLSLGQDFDFVSRLNSPEHLALSSSSMRATGSSSAVFSRSCSTAASTGTPCRSVTASSISWRSLASCSSPRS